VLGNSFSGCALFCLGLTLVGAGRQLGRGGAQSVMVPLGLIAAKSLLLPPLCLYFVST